MCKGQQKPQKFIVMEEADRGLHIKSPERERKGGCQVLPMDYILVGQKVPGPTWCSLVQSDQALVHRLMKLSTCHK